MKLWQFLIGCGFGLFAGFVAGSVAHWIMPGFFVWRVKR
jgi:hypothetical protein